MIKVTRIKVGKGTRGGFPCFNITFWNGGLRVLAVGAPTLDDVSALVADNLGTDGEETLHILECFLENDGDGVDFVEGLSDSGQCWVPFDTNFKRGLNCNADTEIEPLHTVTP